MEAKQKPTVGIYIGALIALMFGLLAFVLGIVGVRGGGGPADRLTAAPNLVAGLVAVPGAIGFMRLRRWSVACFSIAALMMIVTAIMLYLKHSVSGQLRTVQIVFLCIPPGIYLLILAYAVSRLKAGRLV